MTFGLALSLVIFAALMLCVSLHLLAASGHFPLQARGSGMKNPASIVILWFSIALTLAALIAGLLVGWQNLPWQGLIIGGGLAALAAPLVLQKFPDRFVDGRAALITFAAGAIFCATLLMVIP